MSQFKCGSSKLDMAVFYVETEREISQIKKEVMRGRKDLSNIVVLMNHKAVIKDGEDWLTPVHAVCVPDFYRPAEGWSIDGITLY